MARGIVLKCLLNVAKTVAVGVDIRYNVLSVVA